MHFCKKKSTFGEIKYKILTRKIKHINYRPFLCNRKWSVRYGILTGKTKFHGFTDHFCILYLIKRETPYFWAFFSKNLQKWSVISGAERHFLVCFFLKICIFYRPLLILTGNLYLNLPFFRFMSRFCTFLTGFVFAVLFLYIFF